MAGGHPLLQDIRVLDVSRVLAGPFCGQILGDLGADVIKVERPGAGDETRSWGPPFVGTMSAYFLSCNRNKRSIAIDLGHSQGRELLQRLIAKCDVVLENFRPESAARLGLTPEEVHRANPRAILCSISGFGRRSPLSHLPGYDNAIQARSGLMSITGPKEGPPYKVGVAVTDVLTGLYAAIAILACLHARRSSGHGYHLDLALLDCAVAAQVNVAQAYLATGIVPPRQGNEHLQIVPYQLFATADGWIVLSVGNDRQFERFCRAAGRDDLAEDQRFQTNPDRVRHRDVLIPILEELFLQRSTRQWLELLEENEVPHAPVWNYAELFSHEHVAARKMKIRVRTPEGKEVDLIGSPFHIDGRAMTAPEPPPTLAEHTQLVLHDLLGMSADEIRHLENGGVVQ